MSDEAPRLGTCSACQAEGVPVRKASEKDQKGTVRYWHFCEDCEPGARALVNTVPVPGGNSERGNELEWVKVGN